MKFFAKKTTTARDMTEGSIVKQIVLFTLPLMLGNIFQMLYNTVDSIIVGRYVGKQALAAIGATTSIIYILVFFFAGFAMGSGVVIGRYFGAKDFKNLHITIETAMAATFIISIIFTILGIACIDPMLRLMSTPDDVFKEASDYLRIYFAGISGLLIYNMGSGILRAVGDTTRPLYFLILTSVINIVLDILFVRGLRMNIEGAAYATIAAQFISAFLVILLLTGTKDIYVLKFEDLQINKEILKDIVSLGLPAAAQFTITAVSNVFVQSYINYFGSSCMAGWASYNKIDQIIMLTMTSMAMAATVFVSQNVGAGKTERVNQGIKISVGLSLVITLIISVIIWIFAEVSVGRFSSDLEVIWYGVLFLRTNVFFLLFGCVNQVLAGAIRGKGDSKGPMIIMITGFVIIRQIYLFIAANYISNTERIIGLGYPVGWVGTFVMILIYFFMKKDEGLEADL